MRYLAGMGAATGPAVPLPQLSAGGPLDPAVKAQFLALAPTVPDAQAQDLLDFVDATPLGHSTMMKRYALGAVGGLAIGLVIGAVVFKR
jgi:hypothetical protein